MVRIDKSFILICIGVVLIVLPVTNLLPIQVVGTIFSDGFESGDFSAWSQVRGESIMVVSTDDPYAGTYHARVVTEGVTQLEFAYAWITFAEQTSVSSQMAIKFITGLPAQQNDYIEFMVHYDNTGMAVTTFKIMFDGGLKWELVYHAGGLLLNQYAASPAPTLEQWYLVRLDTVIDAVAGSVSAYVNAQLILSDTNLDTSNQVVDALQVGGRRVANNLATEFYFDAVTIDGDVVPPQPVNDWDLTIDSQPVAEVAYTVDSSSGTTGTPLTLEEGTYIVTLPSTITTGGVNYVFSHWVDNDSVSPQRTIVLTSDITLNVVYTIETVDVEPGEGVLEMHVFMDGVEVDATITIIEVSQQVQTGTSGVTVTLPVGTYTVRAAFESQVNELAATVSEGQSTRLDFNFATEPTEPPVTSPEPIRNISTMMMLPLFGCCFVVAGIYFKRKKQ